MGSAITFDFHNTLVRCDAWFELEVRTLPLRVGEILGLPLSDDITAIYRDLRRSVISDGIEIDASTGVVETWRRAGVTADPEMVTSIIDDLMCKLVPESTLLDGAADAVFAARASGAQVGVVSSAVHHEFLEWALAWHEIHAYFDVIVTSASAGFYKSRPEIYQIALARLSARPEDSVHIGDSFRFDHQTSSALGMGTIWLNETGQDPPVDAPSPSAIVQSMNDVPDALASVFLIGRSFNAI